MSRPPTFNELADWVDGRLDDETAADVASRAATHEADVGEALAWLREFRAAAALMPLQSPPAGVRDAAGAAFRHLRAPWSTGEHDELAVDFDSRLVPLAGVRSTAQKSAFHLELSAPGLVIDLDVTSAVGPDVEFTGSITLESTASDGVEESVIAVIFLDHEEERRTAPVDRAGTFGTVVEGDVNQLGVVTTRRRLRVDLGQPQRQY